MVKIVLKKPGNERLNNLNDPVLNVLIGLVALKQIILVLGCFKVGWSLSVI